jgi:hypothetical protein
MPAEPHPSDSLEVGDWVQGEIERDQYLVSCFRSCIAAFRTDDTLWTGTVPPSVSKDFQPLL